MERLNIGCSSYNRGIDATGERVEHKAINCRKLEQFARHGNRYLLLI